MLTPLSPVSLDALSADCAYHAVLSNSSMLTVSGQRDIMSDVSPSPAWSNGYFARTFSSIKAWLRIQMKGFASRFEWSV